jgi:CDGSH-type Zn-finger protein
MKITIKKNGPYMVSGNVPLYTIETDISDDGFPVSYINKKPVKTGPNYPLCRCGNSKNKPFCDGTHINAEFDGTEVAKEDIFSTSLQNLETEDFKLIDAPALCDHTRFCRHAGGIRELLNKGDDESIAIAKEEAKNCPSGRLTLIDNKDNSTTESEFEKEINLIYDNGMKTNGPIWVKGGIPVESDNGKKYELRNRVTLCRCGQSKNKPFCDGSHWASEEFQSKFRAKWNL